MFLGLMTITSWLLEFPFWTIFLTKTGFFCCYSTVIMEAPREAFCPGESILCEPLTLSSVLSFRFMLLFESCLVNPPVLPPHPVDVDIAI
jgi:hypothetical protein